MDVVGLEDHGQDALNLDFIQAWLADTCDAMASPRKRPVTPPPDATPQPAGPSTRLRTRLARAGEMQTSSSAVQDLEITPRPGPSSLPQSSRSLDGSPTKRSTKARQAVRGPHAYSTSGARSSSNAFTTSLALSASRATSVSSEQSGQSGSSKRSQSPVRRGDLGRLAEPITIGTAKIKREDLPPDVANFQPRLNDLLDKDGILPACLKANTTFLGECNDDLRDRMFSASNPGTDIDLALGEFREVLKIAKATEKAVRRGFTEPAWNDTVHSRVLELALAPFEGALEWNNI